MNSNFISVIVKQMDQKIALLQKFKEITEKIAESDFETLTKLIAERQLVINDIDKRTEKIKKVISERSSEEADILEQLVKFQKIECVEEYIPVKEKAGEIEALLIEISEHEKDVRVKMDDIKKNLAEDMLKSNKSRKVIDYCNSLATFSSNGTNFNSLS